jgi:hypothetical protein
MSSISSFVSNKKRPSSPHMRKPKLKLLSPAIGTRVAKDSLFAPHKCLSCHHFRCMRECSENDACADVIVPLNGLPDKGRVDPTCE